MTYAEMKKRVAMRVQDPLMKIMEDAEYGECVNDAIQDLNACGWLLSIDEDTSITLEEDVWAYDVPADFAYIESILLEDITCDPSTFDTVIIKEHWRLGYDDSRNFLYNKDWSFEAGVAYATETGATVSQDDTYHKYGSKSAKVVTDNAAAGEGFYIEFEGQPGVEYTVSAWLYDPAAGAGTVVVSLYDDTTGYQDSDVHTLTATWTQVTVTATTGLHSTTFRLYVHTNLTQSLTFYVDGCAVQQQASVVAQAPVIVFDSRIFVFTSGYRIKVVGQKRPNEITADLTAIEAGMEPFIRERAISYAARTMAQLLPERQAQQQQAAEGESPPGTRIAPIVPDAEERRARRLFVLSERAWANSEAFLANHPMEFRVSPSSEHVPTR